MIIATVLIISDPNTVNGKQIQICELRCSVINTLAGASGSQIN